MRKTFVCLVTAFLMIGISLHSITYSKENEHLVDKKLSSSPQNVILMIGDGMGAGQIEIARLLEYGKEGRLFLESLPFVSLVHTSSADHTVTDSAAGGTALAIGKKTNNGMVGVTPDGKEATSILDTFKKNGKKTGVISTNTVTDATPAAFTASVNNRWSGQDEIARQQLKNGVDVLLGGGADVFKPKHQNGKNLIKEAMNDGYTFVSTRDELLNANGNKLLGLFHSSYMSFKLDRKLINSQEPSLKEMTKKAIEFLSKGNNGFFLMCEGARIDHASHAADLTSVWKEVIEFDHAVQYAVDWAKKDQNTLVLVAADHETMGISATEPLDIKGLKQVKASPEYMVMQFIKKTNSMEYDPESIKNVVKEYANIELTADEIQQYNESIMDESGLVYPQYAAAWELGSVLAKHFNAGIVQRKVRSISTTGGHTSNPIILFAYGKGGDVFHGVLENTDVPKKIAQLMNYDF